MLTTCRLGKCLPRQLVIHDWLDFLIVLRVEYQAEIQKSKSCDKVFLEWVRDKSFYVVEKAPKLYLEDVPALLEVLILGTGLNDTSEKYLPKVRRYRVYTDNVAGLFQY